MRIVGTTGRDDIARAYLAQMRSGRYIEFCESVEPPLPRSTKWVLIVSTMFGCPVGCLMCDAGGEYGGNLSSDEILCQIDFLIRKRFLGKPIDVKKFKIQFARMGEPSLNRAVLEVLRELPDRYDAPGLIPSISSVAPRAGTRFFDELLGLKQSLYGGGRFQLQFSIHTTDRALRDNLIPFEKWGLPAIARYGEAFCQNGDRKITLNSALAEGMPLDPDVLLRFFNPEKFLVKITPLNPTYRAREHDLSSRISLTCGDGEHGVAEDLRKAGYEVIISIGEPEENLIGSNCGQYVIRHLEAAEPLRNGYTYGITGAGV